MFKTKLTACFFAGAMLAFMPGCNDEGPQLNILGLDKNNKELSVKISQADFGQKFSEILNSTSQSSLETLREEEARSQWSLKEVEVGINLQITGGVESVIKLGSGAGASMTLTRQGASRE